MGRVKSRLPPQTLLVSGTLVTVPGLLVGALSIAGRVVGLPLGAGLPDTAGLSAVGAAGLGTVTEPSAAGGTGRIAGLSTGGVGLPTAGLSAGIVGRSETAGLSAG